MVSENKSLILDIQLLIMTVWVIIFPSTRLYERWFKKSSKAKF